MNEQERMELDLKDAMRTRWASKHPSRDLDAQVLKNLSARRTHKRILQFVVAVAVSVVAVVVALLIFTVPTGQGALWLSGFLAPLNPPSYNSTFSTAFACPTTIPTPATRIVSSPPTSAPPPTLGPTRTRRPTRDNKTRVPRRTQTPTPTIEYLSGSGPYKSYQDPEFDYSFEYPADWFIQTTYDTRNMPDIGIPRSNYVIIWNYSGDLNAVPADALYMRLYLDPAFCNASTIEQALARLEPVTEITPLVAREPIAGYPAWQHTVRASYSSAPDMIELLVRRGMWLYRLQAAPANSVQINTFEHLLATFKTP